jgi:hypothetical protein
MHDLKTIQRINAEQVEAAKSAPKTREQQLEAQLAYARKGRDAVRAENDKLRAEIQALKLTIGTARRVLNGAAS